MKDSAKHGERPSPPAPIFQAVSSDNIDRVTAALADPAAIKARCSSGHTSLTFGLSPLHMAKSALVAQALIKAGADVNAFGGGGMRPLHHAAYYGRSDVIKALIAAGAKVDAQSDDLSTPLHWAAVMNQPDAVQALLQAGANPRLLDASGRDPLQRSKLRGEFPNIVELLGKATAEPAKQVDPSTAFFTALRAAMRSYNTGQAEQVINIVAKESLNVREDAGNTPLTLVISWAPVAKKLLEKGADPNKTDLSGQSPLYLCAFRGDVTVINALLAAGADSNATNRNNGSTPLMCVRTAEAAAALLDKGAKLDTQNYIGETALIIASGRGDIDAVKFLLDRGADLNILSYNGRSALRMAEECKRTDVIELLKARGAK